MDKRFDRLFCLGIILNISMVVLVLIVELRLYTLAGCVVLAGLGLVIAFGALVLEEVQYRMRERK